jgi:hypothetical protein
MRVFQDVFTNDEMMSELFKFELAYNDVAMKVRASYKSKESIGNIDIGCGNAFGGGDEDGGAGGEMPAEKVLDVQYNFNLVETPYSKADFMTYIKTFMKNLKTWLEANGKSDRVAEFQKGATEFVKFVVSKFDEFTFYSGSSENVDGGIALSYWENDSDAGPVFFFFRDALKEVKY